VEYHAEPYWQALEDLLRVSRPASPPHQELSDRQRAWQEQKQLNRLMRQAERLYGLPWGEIWRRYAAAVAQPPGA
jgi:hypothetical protein